MPEKIKIVWLAHEGLLSGANLCLLEYAGILMNQGYEIQIITPRLGPLSEKAKSAGIPSHEVYFYHWTVNPSRNNSVKTYLRKAVRNWLAVKNINNLLQSIQPDFVATNTINMNVGALAARRAGIRHVWFVHEFGKEDHGYSLAGGMQQAKKKMNLLSYKIAVNSKAIYETYLPYVQEEKLKIVHNAVLMKDVQLPSQRRARNGWQLIMLGQIAFSKNQEEAIEAISRCREKGLDVSLKIYGNVVQESYAEKLLSLIARHQLQNYIMLNSPVQDIYSLLPAFDALLMCSRAEAFGRVTVEALKCGVPVIGANSGGTPELIENGVNGYLYQAGQADDLARAIEQFIQDKDNFNSKTIAASARALYNENSTFSELKEIFN